MTLAPLPPRRPARPGRYRRPPAEPARLSPVPPPTVTVTITVTASSDARPLIVPDFIDGVRVLADQLAIPVTVTGGALPRSGGPSTPVTVRIEPAGRRVLLGHTVIELTRREFDLLYFLARHPGRVFSRSHLLRSVWYDLPTGERTIDVHVRRLRAKLGDPLVTTVRGFGYGLARDAPVEVLDDPCHRDARTSRWRWRWRS